MLYAFMAPVGISTVAPRLSDLAREFVECIGHTAFGDLFLRNPGTGEIACFFTERLDLMPTGYTTPQEFESEFLNAPGMLKEVLRPAMVDQLSATLHPLKVGEVFFPVPYRALGGSGALDTYQTGDLWVYIDIYAQTVS